jgi:hypothetical protein
MTVLLKGGRTVPGGVGAVVEAGKEAESRVSGVSGSSVEADPDETETGDEVPVPREFEYHSADERDDE